MKKKKLELDELKVKSFVTEHNKNLTQTLKGGGGSENPCPSNGPFGCRSHRVGTPCGDYFPKSFFVVECLGG